MALPDYHDDLEQLFTELRHTVRDSRAVWCKLGTRFETTVTRRKGFRIGGAWSPNFLAGPGPLLLTRARVLFVETALNPVQEWLPLLEGVQREYESLLLVTDEIDPALLATFLINARKDVLSCCVAHPAPLSGPPRSASVTAAKPEGLQLSLPDSGLGRRGRGSEKNSGVAGLGEPPGKGRHSPPKRADEVYLAEEVLVRKGAGVVFPSAQEWSGSLEDFAVIEVGGDHSEDQQARLRFVNEWLRQQDRRGW